MYNYYNSVTECTYYCLQDIYWSYMFIIVKNVTRGVHVEMNDETQTI